MRRIIIYALLILAVGGLLLACRKSQPTTNAVPIRIGWQTGWATEGQLAEVLKHTDILEGHGLAGEFTGFSYGGPLNEAALAGSVDVIFTADQPAATLMARGAKWKIVARLIDFRACLLVPPDSTVKTVADLRGKTITVPFGSSTHRILLSMLKDAGLIPGVDVNINNLDILEQSALAQTDSHGRWGQIDAIASWDPTVALLEFKGLTRSVECRPALAVVVMSQDFLDKNPEAAVRFLKAYRLAYAYYGTHTEQADNWFIEDTKTSLPTSILDTAASFELNIKAKTVNDIQIGLTDTEIASIQKGADFGLTQKLTTISPNMREAIDQSFLNSATTTPELMKLAEVKIQ